MASELVAGTYTVIAFDKNEYFSSISSESDFARLGVVEGSWARQSVDVVAGKMVEVPIDVPDLTIANADEILDSGEVVFTDTRMVPGCTYFARVSYAMKGEKEADRVQVSIPRGLEVVSVATLRKNYGIGGYDSKTGVLSISDIDPAERKGATVFLGLRVAAPGSYGINASVVSGAVIAPLGFASIAAPALALEVPSDELDSATLNVDVYAAPDSVVSFKINDAQLQMTATTNKVGHGTASLTIPENEVGELSIYSVTATLAGQDEASVTKTVEYDTLRFVEPVSEVELSFVHGLNGRVYVVQDGAEKDSWYSVLVNPQSHREVYSPTWPFRSVLKSEYALGQGATLMLMMLDGSLRYEDMRRVGTEANADGTYTYTYSASVAFGDGNPDHPLSACDIPCRFEVIPDYEDEYEVFRPPYLSQANVDAMKASTLSMEQKLNSWGVEPYDPKSDESIWEGIETEGLSQGELDAIAGEIDILDYAIGEKYKHENWKREWNAPDKQDIDVYDTLAAWQKAEVQEFENTVDEQLVVLQQALGDNKPLNEYDSLEEYLEDNYGYTRLDADTVPDPAELEADGYQVTYDSNCAPGEAQWYAIKIEEVGSSTIDTQSAGGDPESLTTQSSEGGEGGIEVSEYGIQCYNALGDQWHKVFNVENQENINNFWIPQALSNGSAIIENGAHHVAGFMTGNWNPRFLVKWRAGGRLVAKGLGWAGVVIAASIIWNNIPKVKRLEDEWKKVRDNLAQLMKKQAMLELKGGIGSKCWKAMQRELAALMEYAAVTYLRLEVARRDMGATAGFAILGVYSGSLSSLIVAPAGAAVSEGYARAENGWLKPWAKKASAKWIKARKDRLKQCKEDTVPKHGLKVGIDPSGFVYEGVLGNRVQGVTATIQHSADGGNTWANWDEAAAYEQINSVVTDASGTFAWDVPMGLWRVLFQHADYESAQTAAMEVPPERTGLAVPLISRFLPTVESVTADNQTVEVVFRQYMNENVAPSVTVSGVVLSDGEWVDSTPIGDDAGATTYARVWRAAMPTGTQLGTILPVTVSGAMNYANKAMESAWSGSVAIAPRPAQVVLDYDGVVCQQARTGRDLHVLVLDAGGNPIEGASVVANASNAELADVSGATEPTDANGATSVHVEALEPGTSRITLTVEGTSLARTVDLLATLDANAAARPTATFADVAVGENDVPAAEYVVNPNTELLLATSTEGAQVYYTTDGSDPSNAGSARQTYTGALPITKSATVRAVAYANGMDFSEELSFVLRVRENIGGASVAAIPAQSYSGGALTPKVTVTLGGKTLVEGTDYDVSYKNNVNPGTATVTITGKGYYMGTRNATFNVVAKNKWLKQDGSWYYYGADGAKAKGWKQVGGKWYYLDPSSGAMRTGWLKSGSTWYYLTSSGAMATGWAKVGNAWYYFNGSGAMLTSWQKLGGSWYYFNGSGAMVTGWLKLGSTWYYLQPSGAMATGWQKVGSTWYLLAGGGQMLTGWQKVGSTWYYFAPSGAMVTGWLKLGSTWYYLSGSGAMVTGRQSIGGRWYTFNSSGAWVA